MPSPRRRKRLQIALPESPFGFTYEEFDEWYERTAETRLEVARQTFDRLLNEWLDRELSDSDRKRFVVASSRVKGINRVWTKMLKDEYRDQINTLDDIPPLIDDLVGIRVTCHNNCDMDKFRLLIAELPSSEDEYEWLCILPESEKKYVDEPKESGYRAYHINIQTLLSTPQGWVPVIGELQARTLLQNGWGELTHEDTYKPGFSLPLHATKLARRMADLLAAVDDIAQDLRDELDLLAQQSLNEADASQTAAEPEVKEISAGDSNSLATALIAETNRVVHGLSKPAILAEIAQRVQASFDAGVTADWGGYHTFTNLVRAAVPDVTIDPVPPGMVIPPGQKIPDRSHTPGVGEEDVPPVVVRLRGSDKDLPAFSRARMGDLFDAAEEVLSVDSWQTLGIDQTKPGIRELNLLSKQARDWAAECDKQVGRKGLNYLLQSLLWTGNLRPGLERSDLVGLFTSFLVSRATMSGCVEDPVGDRQAIEDWLRSA